MLSHYLTASIIPVLAHACFNYGADPVYNPDNTYLCADQSCSNNYMCQSGCCYESLCNDKGKCGEQQFVKSVIIALIIVVLSVGIYFGLHFFYCKKMSEKRRIENEVHRDMQIQEDQSRLLESE